MLKMKININIRNRFLWGLTPFDHKLFIFNLYSHKNFPSFYSSCFYIVNRYPGIIL